MGQSLSELTTLSIECLTTLSQSCVLIISRSGEATCPETPSNRVSRKHRADSQALVDFPGEVRFRSSRRERCDGCTEAPRMGYGYEAALINYAYLAHAVLTTDQAVKAMEHGQP
jgi:hypothetical protein